MRAESFGASIERRRTTPEMHGLAPISLHDDGIEVAIIGQLGFARRNGVLYVRIMAPHTPWKSKGRAKS